MRKRKRFLAWLMAAVMLLTVCPQNVYATSSDASDDTELEQVQEEESGIKVLGDVTEEDTKNNDDSEKEDIDNDEKDPDVEDNDDEEDPEVGDDDDANGDSEDFVLDYMPGYMVSWGDNVTLEVSVTGESEQYTYTWYERYGEEQWEEIEGENQTSYTAKNIEKTMYYACEVTDTSTGNSKSASFTVQLYSSFVLEYKNEVYIDPGDEVDLQVSVKGNADNTYSYQWIDPDENEISGATESKLANVQASGVYQCKVTDQYGEELCAWIRVYVENEFNLTYDDDVTVAAGETARLSVEVDEQGEYTYRWYKSYEDNENLIEDAQDAICDVSNATSGEYICIVTDAYNNSKNAYFYVSVDNGFVANAVGAKKVAADLYGSVTLEVKASAKNGEIHYQWMEDYDDIEEATTNTYKVDNVTQCKYYTCKVSDDYGNNKSIDFKVYIDNNLQVTPGGDIEEGGPGQTFWVTPGEDITVEATATANKGELIYKWYDDVDGECIGTESTYTLKNVQKSKTLMCRVRDIYGNTKTSCTRVNVKSGLNVSQLGDNLIDVREGGSATLAVKASAECGNLTYQWYIYEDEEWQEISDADQAQYTAENITENTDYRCTVSDGYNTKDMFFYIAVVDDGLLVSYNENVYADEYGTAVLSVNADTTTEDANITYQWYDENDEMIAGAVDSKYTVKVTKQSKYSCDISDGKEERTIFITVYPDTGFSAEISNSYIEMEPGETMIVSVNASSRHDLTYEWYKWDDDDNEYVIIPDATGADYELKGEKGVAGSYRCYVSDGYNEADIMFEVSCLTRFDVEGGQDITLQPDQSIELVAFAESNYALSYSWYKYNDETEKYEQIVGADTSSYTVEGKWGAGDYYCLVSDGYNQDTCWYEITIDSGFSAAASSGETAVWLNADGGTSFSVSAKGYGAISYQWYKMNDDGEYEKMSEKTTDTLDIDTTGFYYCEVSDEYNSQRIYFKACEKGETAESIADAKEVTVGNTYLATIVTEGSEMYFKFTPAKDGRYTFTSHDGSDVDVNMYDSDSMQNAIAPMDDGGLQPGFIRGYDLKAGVTYYFVAGYEDDEEIGSFHFDVSSEEDQTHVHQYGEWKTTKAATCTEKGIQTRTCVCGESETRELAMIDHKYGDWKTTKEPTVLAEGTRTKTCSVCKKQISESIAKLKATISVNAKSINLKVKQSTTAVQVTYGKGDGIDSWKSSDTKIVKVNAKGKITAGSKAGSATITVKLKSGLSAKIKVKVQKKEVTTTKVTLNKKSVSLKKGKKFQLETTVTPITSKQKVTYKSSNSKVATVSKKGQIVAKKKGTAKITVTSGKKKATCKVTVK